MERSSATWLPFLHELADRADEIALRHYHSRALEIGVKPDATPVTLADRGIEQTVIDLLRRRHPDVGILGEEEGEQPGHGDTRLIVDPIDGTRNFVRGIPIFATLLAVETAGEVVAGVVSAAALAQRWHAARGVGAFCGPRRLGVTRTGALRDAHLFHGSIGGVAEGNVLPGLQDLARQVHRTRGLGDFYQHVLVAEGAGEIAVDDVVNAWDVAALQVIVEEAGGRCTALSGERTIYGGSLLTTNGVLHEAARRILTGQP